MLSNEGEMEYILIILVVPFIITLVLTSVVLLLFKKWRCSLTLTVVAIILNYFTESIPVNLSQKVVDNHDMILDVISYNIHSGGGYMTEHRDNPEELVQFIFAQNPDVLVLMEYDKNICETLRSRLLQRYPYSEYMRKVYGVCANAIFSKYEIKSFDEMRVDTTEGFGYRLLKLANIDPMRTIDPNRFVMSATLDYKGQSMMLVGCHFSSNEYDSACEVVGDSLSWIDGIPLYAKNIKAGGLQREVEALGVREIVDSCLQNKVPVIVCGDLNDFSGSKTLRILQKDGALCNVWWKRGLGTGFTYHGHHVMHFRLDHVLYSAELRCKDVKVVSQEFSDHDPIIARLELR